MVWIQENHAGGRRVKPRQAASPPAVATARWVTRRPPARCWSLMAERRRPARERTGAPPRPRIAPEPPPDTPAPSRVQQIQQRRIQNSGRDIESKIRAADPGWEGGGHGDQRESEGGERDGDRARDGSRGHGAGPGRRQGTGRGCDQPCRPITTRQRPELTPEMPDERCKQP